ncbi:MAG: hypothetical protein M3R03_05045 [Pseudomonadota bacterium]|nr:hypothetical protein [Pseudomonadota bacterium]
MAALSRVKLIGKFPISTPAHMLRSYYNFPRERCVIVKEFGTTAKWGQRHRRWRRRKSIPIQYHVERASDERAVAAGTRAIGPAALHVELAEMHEQAAASDVNQRLAPFHYSRAWRKFAR